MKNGFVKVAAAAPKIRVADTAYNAGQITAAMDEAAKRGVKILVFPELGITGSTCGDLFRQKTLLSGALCALSEITDASRGRDTLCFVGLPLEHGGKLYSCAAAVYDGALLGVVPMSDVADGKGRWFSAASGGISEITPGGRSAPFGAELLFRHRSMPGLCVAVESGGDLELPQPPSSRHTIAGATVIVNPAACAETVSADKYRRLLIAGQSARLACGYIYAGAGEGESTTDLVFTGRKLICEGGEFLAEGEGVEMLSAELDVERLAADRRRRAAPPEPAGYTTVAWGGELSQTELTRKISKSPFVPEDAAELKRRCEKILRLQSLGLKKRLEHSGAKSVVIGLSGGLDSTLALLVCRRAFDLLEISPENIIAVTMPCFGTTERTKLNAMLLAKYLGAALREIDIRPSVLRHFEDIGHSYKDKDAVFENAQARERTQVLMDIANAAGGLVVGTGDMSELALGWATYNGDHMSMYGVNAGVPKTLLRHLVSHCADSCSGPDLAAVLRDILDTPVSPELLPAENGKISQKTEDIVGPYELHDFFLYHLIRRGFTPKKTLLLAERAFSAEYDRETIKKWLGTFISRFFSQQFKRSCMPDGPKMGSLSLSPRGGLSMPSDAVAALWIEELSGL